MKTIPFYLFLFYYFIFYAHCVELENNEPELFNGPLARGIRHWSKRDRVIFDCDGSLADIAALFMLLRAEAKGKGPRVVAVTIVGRNDISVKRLGINIARCLREAGREDIPYYLGADESLLFTPEGGVGPYGNDALGDVPYDPAGLPPPQEEVAALALIRIVDESKGHAVIISCAAMTNIALAQRIDKKFLSKVKSIIISNGAVEGIGTTIPGIEAKAWRDPEALKVVLSNTYYKSALMLPNDPIFKINSEIPTKYWMNKFYEIPDPFIQFIKAASQVYWNNGAPQGYVLNDSVVVAIYLWPHIIQMCEAHNVTVSTNCECRGALFGGVTDFSNWRNDPEGSNVYVILKVDTQAYVDNLVKLFSSQKKPE